MKKFSGLLLVSDFDGTFFSHPVIPRRNLEAVRYFMEEGGRFTICTGRAMQSLEIHIDDIPVNAPVIVANGGMIYDYAERRIVQSRCMDESAREIVAKLMERFPGVGVELYVGTETFVAHRNAWVDRQIEGDLRNWREMPLGEIPSQWVKCILTDDPKELPAVQEYLHTLGAPQIEDIFTAPFFLELFRAGVNKGTGLKLLADQLGIPMENTFSVGDYYNDIALVQAAAHGYAVEGGPQELLEAAEATVCRPDQGAVAHVVELIERTISN